MIYGPAHTTKPFHSILLCSSVIILISSNLWAADVIFLKGGTALGQIVVADVPDPLGKMTGYTTWTIDRTRNTSFAAEFLQRYIEEATGVKLPIVSEYYASQNRPLILVGRSRLTIFLEHDRRKLPSEGFIIRRRGNMVAIVGEIAPDDDLDAYRGADRGTLFGVYEFLERFCGVRWYFPGRLGIVIPKRTSLAVGEIDIKSAPYFTMRFGPIRDDPGEGFWGDKHPVSRQGNTTGFWVTHTGDKWNKYVREYPEIFAVTSDGQRNVFQGGYGTNKQNQLNLTHPKVLEIELQQFRNFYEKGIDYWGADLRPNERYVRFFPRDGMKIYHDQSPASRALWTSERHNSKLSDYVFDYVKRMANAVAVLYPGKRVATAAYTGYLLPPSHVHLPENVDIMLCTVQGNALLPNRFYWRYNSDLVDQWFEHLGRDRRRLFLWEYSVYPKNHLKLYPHVMQRWMQRNKDKISGAFNNAHSLKSMEYRLSTINSWLWHQLLWNPDIDVDASLAEMYRNLFGPAGPAMAGIFNLAIDRWENAKWFEEFSHSDVSWVHDHFLYNTIYSPRVRGKMQELLQQARKRAPKGSIYAERVEYYGEALDDMFKKASDYRTWWGNK